MLIFLLAASFVCFAQEESAPTGTNPVSEVVNDSKEKEKDKEKPKAEKGDKLQFNIFRSFLTQFSLSLSTGYGQTYYSHNLRGMGVYQSALGGDVFIFDQAYFGDSNIPVVYQNWVNNPSGIGGFIIPDPITGNPITTNGIPVGPNDFVMAYDSIPIGYKSVAHSAPFTATIFMDINRYRFGGGATIEFQRLGTFKPTQLKDTLSSFKTDFSAATFKRYFGYVGVIVYESWQYKMLVDLQFGNINRGRNFNKSLSTSSLYFNAGYTLEKSLSEYFKVFIRPSVEWKSYTMSIPETGLEITHRQPSLFVQFGATIKMPELPRCTVPGCKTQINHVHGNKEYRCKLHPIWKWQNPNYGQNYPKPMKDKWRNRNKDYVY